MTIPCLLALSASIHMSQAARADRASSTQALAKNVVKLQGEAPTKAGQNGEGGRHKGALLENKGSKFRVPQRLILSNMAVVDPQLAADCSAFSLMSSSELQGKLS